MTRRICIVGVGAIGALYAAHLAQLGEVEVWAYDVARDHVDAINRDGLRIAGAAELTAGVHARTEPAEIPPCQLGVVAAKGTFTRPAIAATASISTLNSGRENPDTTSSVEAGGGVPINSSRTFM